MKPNTINANLLVTMVILMITIGQSVDIYLPSMPGLVNSFNTTISLVQNSMTIAMMFFGISIIIYGPLSDYYGRRITALVGISIFVIGSLICVFSQTIYIFLLGRAIQGLGIGSAGAVCAPILKDRLQGSDLVKAFSYVSIAMAISPVLAPVLGGYFQTYFGWQANFIFLAVYSGLIWLLFYFKLPETNISTQKNSFSVKQIAKDYLMVLGDLQVWGFSLCFMAVFAGEISYFIILPFIVQETLGMSPIVNGWLMVITAIGLILGAFTSSKLSAILSIKKLIAIGLSFIVFGSLVMFLFALTNKVNIFIIVVPMMFYIFGTGIIYPNCIAGAINLYERNSGVVSSILSSLQMLSAGCATLVAANVNALYQLPLSIIIMMTTAIALLSFILLIQRS